MSWYSSAVTGKVPDYVAEKERWDLEDYIRTGAEYMKYTDMNDYQLNQAIEYARKHQPSSQEKVVQIGDVKFIVHK